jgi:hypothetical protein
MEVTNALPMNASTEPPIQFLELPPLDDSTQQFMEFLMDQIKRGADGRYYEKGVYDLLNEPIPATGIRTVRS